MSSQRATSSPPHAIPHSPGISLWQTRQTRLGIPGKPLLSIGGSAGCGVSVEDHRQAKDPLLTGLYCFHVYYTTRHLLKVALPGDKSYSLYENTYDARAYKRLCTEFGVAPSTDWRQKLDHGCQGLGSWSTFMTPSGKYRHAHFSDGPFFHPKDAIRHKRDISGVWTMFIPINQKASRKRVCSASTTVYGCMCGQSWERKPRCARTFSRTGLGSTLKSNLWRISKMHLLLQSTSPVASLAIKRCSSMPPHHLITSSG